MKLKNTHYDTLGVPETATHQQIKSAYRVLLLKQHPDKAAAIGNPEENTTSRLEQLLEAYRVLSKPSERSAYDHKLYKLRNWHEYPDIHDEIISMAFLSEDFEDLDELSEVFSFNPSAAIKALGLQKKNTLKWLLTKGGIDAHTILTTLVAKAIEMHYLDGFKVIVDLVGKSTISTLRFKSEGDHSSQVFTGFTNPSISIIRQIVEKQNSQMLMFLLENSADAFNLNEEKFPCTLRLFPDGHSWSPFANNDPPLLFHPVLHRNLDMLKIFQQNGAHMNIRDRQGRNALHFAISHVENPSEVIELLLNLNVNMNDKMNRGHLTEREFLMPFDRHDQKTRDILLEPFSAFTLAVYLLNDEVVDLFLQDKYQDALQLDSLNEGIRLAEVFATKNSDRQQAAKYAAILRRLRAYNHKHYKFDLFSLRDVKRKNNTRGQRLRWLLTDIVEHVLQSLIYFAPVALLGIMSIEHPELRGLLPIMAQVCTAALVAFRYSVPMFRAAMNYARVFYNAVKLSIFGGSTSTPSPQVEPQQPGNRQARNSIGNASPSLLFGTRTESSSYPTSDQNLDAGNDSNYRPARVSPSI